MQTLTVTKGKKAHEIEIPTEIDCKGPEAIAAYVKEQGFDALPDGEAARKKRIEEADRKAREAEAKAAEAAEG